MNNEEEMNNEEQPKRADDPPPEFLPQGTLPRVYRTKPNSPQGAQYTDAADRQYEVTLEGALRRINKPLSKKARRRAMKG